MQVVLGAGQPHPDVAVVHRQRVAGTVGEDPQRQGRPVGHVADEKAGLVAGQVPGLGREARRPVLLQPQGRRVAIEDMQLDRGGRGADADPAAVVDIQRMRPGAGLDGEGDAVAADVGDRELRLAAVDAVVDRQFPVVARIGPRDRGVVELDPQVVFLQPDRIEAEAFAVDAVKADTGRSVDDQVVGDHLVRLCRQGGRQEQGGSKQGDRCAGPCGTRPLANRFGTVSVKGHFAVSPAVIRPERAGSIASIGSGIAKQMTLRKDLSGKTLFRKRVGSWRDLLGPVPPERPSARPAGCRSAPAARPAPLATEGCTASALRPFPAARTASRSGSDRRR